MSQETPTIVYQRHRNAMIARVKIRWNAAEQQWEMRGYGPMHGNSKYLGYCKKATDLVNHLNKVPKEQRMKFAFRDSFLAADGVSSHV
jgi:hypothetical protein